MLQVACYRQLKRDRDKMGVKSIVEVRWVLLQAASRYGGCSLNSVKASWLPAGSVKKQWNLQQTV
eukprot:1138339-Pelagomonas_calceolata.AAC.14